MFDRKLIFWSLVSMIPCGIVGWWAAGIAGFKLAFGIIVMFAMTYGIFAHFIKEIEKDRVYED